MKSATRKTPWTRAERIAFAGRCQVLRDRVSALIEALPETWGLTVDHVDAWVAVHTALGMAMRGAEDVLDSRREDGPGAIRLLPGNLPTPNRGPRRGRVRRGAPVLSRDRWIALGCEVNAIRAEALALDVEFREAIGSTPESRRRFARVVHAIIPARCGLDALVGLQHPGWRESSRVFYGPAVPRPVPPPNGAHHE